MRAALPSKAKNERKGREKRVNFPSAHLPLHLNVHVDLKSVAANHFFSLLLTDIKLNYSDIITAYVCECKRSWPEDWN